ncbi:Multimodular transpeptidase-transglycosylase [hydrothermal vent metagenome]|uniref:peptidoglycan glycosyltransferase n=1 Tax=hydrothermal vent metagenome TaxID=652676 RepID=A0A1W1BW41_9ZZZZ
MIKKLLIGMLVLLFLAPVGVLVYYLSAYKYDISKLVEYNPPKTTRIYDKNGKKIANIFASEHRYYAPFEELPPRLIEALLAIEDTSFFEHPGVNFDAIFRAVIKDIKARKMVEGASTITQQLVKNELLTREKKLSRKIKEIIYSLKLERYLTKEQILERYFNEIYFGHGYYGVKTAADGYFHKKLDELTLKEMAMLVGMPKAPSTYNPTRNYEISLGRANRVLSRMFQLGWIDEETYKKALMERPQVYNSTLTQNRAPFIVDEVLRRAKALGIDDIKTGGYEIYTSIDLNLQDAAKKALSYAYKKALKRIEYYKKREQKRIKQDPTYIPQDVNVSQLNGALVSLDNKTGDILALVGSVDYKKSSYNRATQGKRQPGSAFKPFIYQVALDLGYSGATKLVDVARTYKYEKDGEDLKWQPKNYEKDYKGLISLREALIHSRNLATINLVNDIGLSTLLKELKKFGIKNLPHDLSISLGTITLSPLELAHYYTSFANKGMQVQPHLIMSIEEDGTQIYKKDEESRYITSPKQAFIMTTILRDVVKRGTGRKAAVKGLEVAGKTGTTNKSIDAWFAGYSPTIETIVWFGNDDNSPMYKGETGGRVSGPAFSKYYEQVLKLYPQIQRKFVKPEGIIEVKMGGITEYFSDISKPPAKESDEQEERLIF